MATSSQLLERDEELASLERVLGGAAEGAGGLVLIEGEAGAGKTSLLEAAAGMVGKRGMLALRARGGAHERDFPYGVIRQLLEPQLSDPARRAEALTGAAALASPVFDPDPTRSSALDPLAAQHGLYWLIADLAGEPAPLAILVDDAQWADPPSLRALLYIARRLEGIAAALILTVRTGEPDIQVALIDELRRVAGAEAVVPAALSEAAGLELIVAELGETPTPDFAAACHRASAGNPFLAVELMRGLRVEGVAPSDESAARVESFAAAGISRSIQARLARLGDVEVEVARAVAVLEPNARPELVTALAQTDPAIAAEASARLIEARLLTEGSDLGFVHPLVRNAVYSDTREPRRALMHAEAARLLRGVGAEPDSVAAHLLLAPPAGDQEVIETLRGAAATALRRGAPDGAVRYLRRAREETADPSQRLQTSRELGEALILTDDEHGIVELAAVRAASSDPLARAEIAARLCESFGIRDRHRESRAMLEESLAEVGNLDAPTAMRLRTELIKIAYIGGSFSDPTELIVELEGVEGKTHVERLFLAAAAYLIALGLSPVEKSLEAAGRAIRDPRVVIEDAATGYPGTPALSALALAGWPDLALLRLADQAEVVRQRGSSVGLAIVSLLRSLCLYVRGDLAEAEAESQFALTLFAASGAVLVIRLATAMSARVLVQRGELEAASALLERHDLTAGGGSGFPGAALRISRGELALACGRGVEAREDFLAAAGCIEWLPYANLEILGWRTGLARSEAALGNEEEARKLADEAVRVARQAGGERGIGIALACQGALAGGEDGIEALREATALLDRSAASLQRAHALVDLGAALRRANRRRDAREPLREGLDLAHHCGAIPLEERARTELEATGARPRSAVLSGVESLTPSELRVARMAAEGRTNREIAQGLFVTAKTVETHLRQVYRKLDVAGRTELTGALGDRSEDRRGQG